MSFNDKCLDEWQADKDHFRVTFLEFVHPLTKALGAYVHFDQKALDRAHQAWCSQCIHWMTQGPAQSSSILSHVKIAALLLHQLAQTGWIKRIEKFDPQDDGHDGLDFNGSEADRAECLKDLVAGREAWLALQFVTGVIGWFEHGREDRLGEFVPRMTDELEYDLVHYLRTGSDELALYLILKALFVRDAN